MAKAVAVEDPRGEAHHPPRPPLTLLDPEDRAHIALAVPIFVRWAAGIVLALVLVVVFAVTAGVAMQLFRIISGW